MHSDSETDERPKGIYTSNLKERRNRKRKRDTKSEQVHGDHNAPDLKLADVSAQAHLQQGI